MDTIPSDYKTLCPFLPDLQRGGYLSQQNIDAFVLKLLGPCSPDDPPEMKRGYLGNLSHRATMAEVCLGCCQFMLFMLNESDDNS